MQVYENGIPRKLLDSIIVYLEIIWFIYYCNFETTLQNLRIINVILRKPDCKLTKFLFVTQLINHNNKNISHSTYLLNHDFTLPVLICYHVQRKTLHPQNHHSGKLLH